MRRLRRRKEREPHVVSIDRIAFRPLSAPGRSRCLSRGISDPVTELQGIGESAERSRGKPIIGRP